MLLCNVVVGFHVCLNDFQIKWTQFAQQKYAFFFSLHNLGSDIQVGVLLDHLLAVTRIMQ